MWWGWWCDVDCDDCDCESDWDWEFGGDWDNKSVWDTEELDCDLLSVAGGDWEMDLDCVGVIAFIDVGLCANGLEDEIEELDGRETRDITGDELAEPLVGTGELGREEFLSALRNGGDSDVDISATARAEWTRDCGSDGEVIRRSFNYQSSAQFRFLATSTLPPSYLHNVVRKSR